MIHLIFQNEIRKRNLGLGFGRGILKWNLETGFGIGTWKSDLKAKSMESTIGIFQTGG